MNGLAGQLLEKSRIAGGIVCLPHCQDARLAATLARSGRVIVHAMSTSAGVVDALDRVSRSDVLLERSLYAEQGRPSAIPFADDYVNLVAVTDATDENLATLSAAEIVRVLAPSPGWPWWGRPGRMPAA